MRAAICLGAAIAVASLACTWKLTPDDDAGTADAGSQTIGDQCAEVGTEFCLQYVNRCSPTTSLTDCTANFQAQCCVASACSKLASVASSTVDSCRSELDGQDCYAFTISVFPSDCQSVMSQ
jgi:hypothetical protein